MTLEMFATPGSREYEAEFESFWAIFPKRNGNPKAPARAEWNKLAKGDRLPPLPLMLQAVRAFKNHHDKEKTDPKFIPHARTWLHQQRWNDWIKAERAPAPIDSADWADADPVWSDWKRFFIGTFGPTLWVSWFRRARVDPSSNGRSLIVPTNFDKEKIEIQYEGLMERHFGYRVTIRVA